MTDKNKQHHYLSYGIGFGLLGGALFAMIIGALFEFPLIWAFGPGIGTLIGVVVGTLMDSNKKK